jgi:hypothetical protein
MYTREDYWQDVSAILRARSLVTAYDIARAMQATGHYGLEVEAALEIRRREEDPI